MLDNGIVVSTAAEVMGCIMSLASVWLPYLLHAVIAVLSWSLQIDEGDATPFRQVPTSSFTY